jgi:hypothetical protein
VTPPTVNCEIVFEAVPVSTSVSLLNTFPVIVVFSGVETVSPIIVGSSFTGVTVKFKFAVFVAVPSEWLVIRHYNLNQV